MMPMAVAIPSISETFDSGTLVSAGASGGSLIPAGWERERSGTGTGAEAAGPGEAAAERKHAAAPKIVTANRRKESAKFAFIGRLG